MMKVMQPNTRGFVLEDGTGPISLNNSFDLSTYGHELLHKCQ